ncbi:flavin-containing amine oxidoreductase-domain containing protein [Xylogone sp. PMI_703]|nr:flavin-containing amine oxidoreductase-domain containing protein [Xylogone sp. PMI_703]
MATTMEAQTSLQDDLTHDTLMGLQELDSHLSMFDSSNAVSTPGAMSNTSMDESIQLDEVPSHTIVVDSSYSRYSSDHVAEIDTPASTAGAKLLLSRSIKVEPQSNHIATSHDTLYIKAESARESLVSSMMSDLTDASSALSSLSSKATTPTGFDSKSTKKVSNSPRSSRLRQKYDVRPKLSIPTDIAPSEYARQCIAAAEASRLNPYSLHPEEHTMFRNHLSHQQVTTYLNIRNGILRLWTRNPLIGVMRDEAIGCAKDIRWFEVAVICHEWLVRRGYINYGCLEQTPIGAEAKKSRSGKRKQKTVAVIGAGMSGLGCARQLEGLFSQFEDRFHEMGEEVPRVVVLEGRDRIGGRVYSRALKSKPKQSSMLGKGSRCTAEMGGMIITGFDRGNPLNIIVRGQLALPYHALRPDTTIYDATGRPVDLNRDQYAEKLFNYILDRVSEYKFKVEQPPLVDGDRDLLDAGRDPSIEGTKSIREVEEGAPASSQSPSNPPPSAVAEMQLVPVSSDRLTGRVNMEPGIPAVHTAAYKAREIGWLLRPGVGIEADLDLEPAVRSRDATLGSVFDEAIRQYTRIVDFTPLDLRLINWHVANLEYSNATTCNKLSLGGWDLDAGNEWEGKHTMVTGGYQQVPRGLLNCPRPLDVRKKSAVKRITYSQQDSKPSKIVFINGEIIEADYIVSSLPLGVLKRQDIEFEPPLPDWKTGAIRRIGFGTLNKVILVYSEPFWDPQRDIFGTLRNPLDRFSLEQKEYFSKRGRFFQWFNCTNTAGLPTLIALMAGDAAFHTEKATNEDLIAEATDVLKSVFGSAVPKPVEAVVTRWGRDQFSYGSYSYTGPNFQPDDYEVMAKPVGNLFFAGEHTCGTHPATVHGAYISGLRAASEVLEAMIGPIKIQEPLVPPKESNGAKRKAEAIQSQQDPKQAAIEAYELEIWNCIYSKIGDRPWRPPNNYANPYRMYSKDKWEEAKAKCEEGRRPGKGKPIPNEVKKMVTKMWKEASELEKAPYNEKAAEHKKAYGAALAEFNEKAAKWDKEALAIRGEFIKAHPMAASPEEALDSPARRDRRAKRISGYAENSDSDVEL